MVGAGAGQEEGQTRAREVAAGASGHPLRPGISPVNPLVYLALPRHSFITLTGSLLSTILHFVYIICEYVSKP